ncbi:hypothetical protein B296_00015920 [Ensete ventricosum]|uniref:Uncharacterized protein n=1 Tax=Ensete ventricosum TaxID=4639 RepID=A0A426ZMP7_ENSVE|nr:hypothetical protein B296_00015920 [Ensete ventricosum]
MSYVLLRKGGGTFPFNPGFGTDALSFFAVVTPCPPSTPPLPLLCSIYPPPTLDHAARPQDNPHSNQAGIQIFRRRDGRLGFTETIIGSPERVEPSEGFSLAGLGFSSRDFWNATGGTLTNKSRSSIGEDPHLLIVREPTTSSSFPQVGRWSI